MTLIKKVDFYFFGKSIVIVVVVSQSISLPAMLDDVEAGAEVEAADVGGVADGALPGLHSLGRGPGAGAQRGRPLAPP